MARRGRKRRLEIESEYWRLLESGVGTAEACRQLGIGRKTGYRWRAERGGLPPQHLSESRRSSRYLSLLGRQRIATPRRDGLGVRAVARRMGRAPSTISRELRRDTAAHDHAYDGDLAHARARERERARRPRSCRLLADAELRGVVTKLELEWSPERIAAWLRATYPDQPGWHVCHETIYQALYQGGCGGLGRQPTRRLRTGRPVRKRRRRPQARTLRFVTPGTPIHDRPPRAATGHRVGDWEGDLILGRGNRSAVGTLVDRASRYVRLVYLPGDHSAEAVRKGLLDTFGTVPEDARWTLTWDEGSELACHPQVAPPLREGVFLADPGSPWQRGTNENTDGLLHQYLPKGTDLSVRTLGDLRKLEDRLDHRPRMILGWRTPAEVFGELLRS